MKYCIVLGTRPEIIKMSPLIREFEKRELSFFLVHTNQHYSQALDRVFFDELALPRPMYNLGVGSGSQAQEVAYMLLGIEKVLRRQKPHIVLIEGDTNTVLATALVAAKLGVPIGHIEAGLRSYDRKMPEEINRIVADHLSTYLFAPTKTSKDILLKEGISSRRVFITGNPIVDVIHEHVDMAKKKSTIIRKLKLEKKEFFLATAHREENVDNKERLKGILRGLFLLHQTFLVPIVFPMHPRTKKMLRRFRLRVPPGITSIGPVEFLDFLQLECNAKLILTDSGGVQEEACVLRIPCVTMRDNTERPETIEVGANMLAGAVPGKIVLATSKMLLRSQWVNPLGDGKAAKKILHILEKRPV